MPMSTKPIAGRVRKTYEFIKAHRDEHSVPMMCRPLGVALHLQEQLCSCERRDSDRPRPRKARRRVHAHDAA
jgi:hypothetical protein